MPIGPGPKTPSIGTGIEAQFTGTDSAYAIEVERAPDDGMGSPDTANSETIQFLPPGVDTFIDELPLDDTYRHWRGRHVGDDVDPGAWTSWLKLKPVELT